LNKPGKEPDFLPQEPSFSRSCISDPHREKCKASRKSIYEDADMSLKKTLKYFCSQEKQSGQLLLNAVCRDKKKKYEMLISANSLYLPAVNTKARVKWGTSLIRELFEFFNVTDTESDPQIPVFFVTLADKSLITSAQPQTIDLELFKRKLGGRMRGLNYLGMIEPGYYYNAFDEESAKAPPFVSWHGHFLVWGIGRKRLSRIIKKLNTKLEAVMPDFAAAHWKRVERGKFGKKICYLAKSPSKEYSAGKYTEPGKNGNPHYKHNKRDIRPGTRVKLFHLMQSMYLDQLIMAGSDGVPILKKVKFAAMKDYRRRYGWSERRP
jgi:hypothetical protein